MKKKKNPNFVEFKFSEMFTSFYFLRGSDTCQPRQHCALNDSALCLLYSPERQEKIMFEQSIAAF